MVYDTRRDVVVMFGGATVPSVAAPSADVWEWDGVNWSLRTPAGGVAPPPRSYAGVAYDVRRGRTVVYGGITATTSLADHWEWDGTRWTQVVPSGATPGARQGQQMTYEIASAGRLF